MEKINNRITQLFKIDYPIIQAGMVWTSGWKLAAAVSNAGGLGIIGAGSMTLEILEEHLQKYYANTQKPLAVNLPLLYSKVEEQMEIILKYKVPIVFTSAGNPAKYTQFLKEKGLIVVHVVSSSTFAIKAEKAGCDAVVAEGFEAGGHNGREETTSLCLIPMVVEAVKIPVIAAGGFATGKQMLAAFAMGAEAVQVGTRFVCSNEASSHPKFKDMILSSVEGDTKLSLKKTVPVRLLKNNFAHLIWEAENKGASPEDLNAILGKGRAKLGMFDGNLEDGELEIGQIAAFIKNIKPAADILKEIWQEFINCKKIISNL